MICLNQINNYNKCQLVCNHNEFCHDCISNWLENNNNICPVCRKNSSIVKHENIFQIITNKYNKKYFSKGNKSNKYIIYRILSCDGLIYCIKIIKRVSSYEEAQKICDQYQNKNNINDVFISKI